LNKVVMAARLPNCYVPPLIPNANLGMIDVMVPFLAPAKSLSIALLDRAMLELHRHEFAARARDVLAAHRLARLVCKPPYLFADMVAYGMEERACEADEAMANVGWITTDDYRGYLHQLRRLPSFSPLARAFNMGQR
jgi:hypothetical protein